MVQISSKGHKVTEWQSSWILLTLEFGGSIKGLLFLRIFKKQTTIHQTLKTLEISFTL